MYVTGFIVVVLLILAVLTLNPCWWRGHVPKGFWRSKRVDGKFTKIKEAQCARCDKWFDRK